MTRKPHIVVAEDDPELLSTLVSALEDTGAAVTPVENGADLIHVVAEERPLDLMVTDISMPWMSGLQVARATRHAHIEMPIIIISALDTSDLEKQVRSLGGHTMLLRKPFNLDELRGAVQALLAISMPQNASSGS
jgi:DNA-binding response OmpR family regulator